MTLDLHILKNQVKESSDRYFGKIKNFCYSKTVKTKRLQLKLFTKKFKKSNQIGKIF